MFIPVVPNGTVLKLMLLPWWLLAKLSNRKI